jgi:hypothetical protein
MKRLASMVAAVGSATIGLAVVAQAPASAAVVTSVSGTTITVTMTGDGSAVFDCGGGHVLVNTVATSPTLACSALTKVTVTGDSGNQTVYGASLAWTKFTAHPTIDANTGDGADTISDTLGADSIAAGPGSDYVIVSAPSVANTLTDLNAGTDRLIVYGTSGNDTITANSGSSNLLVNWSDGSHNATYQATGADVIEVEGDAGNDTIDTTGIVPASTIDYVINSGGDGNDTLTNGAVNGAIEGGRGTNVMSGGTGNENIDAWGDGDTVSPGLGTNYITDANSLRSGGRILHLTSTNDTYSTDLQRNDATYRLRPTSGAPGDAATVTAALNRYGQQVLPTGLKSATVNFSVNGGGLDSRHVADIVLPSGKIPQVVVQGDEADNDLVDLTVPVGTWAESGTSGVLVTVDPDDPSLGTLTAINIADDQGHLFVHQPWSDPNQSFVHRANRDLLFQFLDAIARDTKAAQLTAHTLTRAQYTSQLVNTDAYRGLDVDRVFVRYLHRVTDPGGRTYWINSLRNGKSLRQFRAQLLGSNEYFTKAGASNASFMITAYADVLGRLPDSAGQTYWTNKLNDGADRGAVARQFLASTEARRNIVKDQFLRFIDRLPTTAESNSWIATLGSHAQGEQELVAFLVDSNAYFSRS